MEVKQFEELQESHRKSKQNEIRLALEEIKRLLIETYEPFLTNGMDIQKLWFQLVNKIDVHIEESLKKCVKNSLLLLSSVVGGESEKQTPIPIFKLSLEIDQEKNELAYRPSTEYLKDMMALTMASMTEILIDFKRMEILIHEERK